MRSAAYAVAVSVVMAVCGSTLGQANRPGTPPVNPERQAYLREHYTKFEHKIPMRDGTRLFTSVYVPKDDAVKYPILLTRTPYTVRPYGENMYPDPRGPMNFYAEEKFIFVNQDVRGKNGSEGTYVHMRPINPAKKSPTDFDESTDAYDTIDWLVKNIPNNNGNVGMMGISYPGFYSAAGMIDSHPALKAVSPQAPIADWFIGDDFHHNGAFYLPHAFNFLSGFGQKLDNPLRQTAVRFDYETANGYEFYLNMGSLSNADSKYFKGKIEFWSELMEHPNYDEFWQARNLRPHLKNVKAAVMTVGGWYDAEDLFGALQIYKETERLNPGIANTIVMGPWSHGQWASPDGDRLGLVNFNAKTAQYYRDKVELPFLKHYLKGDPNFKPAEAVVFETGTDQWRRFDAWPPKNVRERSLFLRAGGKLAFEAPPIAEAPFDEYISDPNKPVPYTMTIAIGMTREHMVDDQRFASMRPDVLVYQTPPLEENVTLAGPIVASLQVATTGTDSDFVVKVIDVYSNDFPNPEPNPAPPQNVEMGGYQQLVRGELMRGRFRNSYSKPEAFVPRQVSKVEWVLPDVYHTFRKGHRIMIQVQSSWFPLVDRNPQKFVESIYKAKEEDFQTATQRVYHVPNAASQIKVHVLEAPRPANGE